MSVFFEIVCVCDGFIFGVVIVCVYECEGGFVIVVNGEFE